MFQFRGLSSKIYVAFLITAVLPVTIACIVSVFYSLETLKNETLYHLAQEVANKADSMARFIEQLRSDVLYLGNYSAMLDFTEAMASHSEAKMGVARSRLENDFAAFARTYPHVYQVRFLDIQGLEIVINLSVIISTTRSKLKWGKSIFRRWIEILSEVRWNIQKNR